MADRPILFSGPMVRALWADRKTQTRRLCKDQPPAGVTIIRKTIRPFGKEPYHAFERRTKFGNFGGEVPVRISRGDRLWVRETWSHTGDHVFSISEARLSPFGYAIYQADDNPEHPHAKFWPSIHMPREFSRLTLIVTDVRIERLQDISNEDCIAEGVPIDPNPRAPRTGPAIDEFARKHGLISHYGAAYRQIWTEINGSGSWDANPWVAAYTFRVIKQNIDQIDREAA